MNVVGVIPARWGSTRFAGKPLALIAGKPLLQWVIEGVGHSRKLTKLIVATDDQRIADLARRLQVDVAMTSPDCATGTDRVWQACRDLSCDVVVNIQGDEPLIRGEIIDALVTPFEQDQQLEMATLGRPLSFEALHSTTTAKVVLNHRNEALYFSRYPIPYSRVEAQSGQKLEAALQHIGVYAFKKAFLQDFCRQAPVAIELSESLEQLRALYLGARIRVVPVEHESWGVDTPEDVKKIEKILKRES